MEPIQAQMVFCCAEQWMGGRFYQVEPWGDGLRLDSGPRRHRGVLHGGGGQRGERLSWGRVAVEADLPPDTALRVYAYASDTRQWGDWADLDQGIQSLEGDPMPALREIFGPPVAESGDCLLRRTGRYLWLMLELTATGAGSPVIHALRLWMRGDHMVDYLPAIYQEEDFTRRFLSIFDSVFTDMERAIDGLPGQMDYEHARGELLRYLASWVCVEGGTATSCCGSASAPPCPTMRSCTPWRGCGGACAGSPAGSPSSSSTSRCPPTGRTADPELYRRLYGEDPYRFFVLLPEDTFSSQRERQQFQRDMEEVIPAGMSMQMVQLKPCVQLDWHTYLGINSRVGGYVPAAIDEQVTIHYDTTIGGANHESR